MSDYRSVRTFKSREEADKYKGTSVSPRWWEREDEVELAEAVCSAGEALHDRAGERRAANLRWARLYENSDLSSLAGGEYHSSISRQLMYGAGLVSFNVVAMACDTLGAKIAKNRPKPTFITSGGSWDMQMKARRLEKWAKGLFHEVKIYQKAPQVFLDGCEFGTGILYVYQAEDKRLECERVLPDELYVDDSDGFYGQPQQVIRRKVVSRDRLAALYPEYREQILVCGKTDTGNNTSSEVADNSLEVFEAWHLPSGKKTKDGKHVIAIDNCCLFQERWKLDKAPFVFYRFKKRTTGFWGKGVAESVAGIQVELNRLVRSVSEQLRRKGRGRVFVAMGSKVNPAALTNGIGDIINYIGQPPTVDNSNSIAPEEFQQIAALKQAALQEVGLSEMSASAKKPSGLDAAVALREYSDIESERFALVHQAWEQFFLDFAELAIDMVANQVGGSGYEVRVPGRRSVVMIDWKDIDLDRDSYVMQCFPSSSLPQTPAARYAKVKEMQQDGFITPPVAKRLLEFPDIESETNLENAVLDDADATISAILDEEAPKIMPLEPYQNLDMIISRANAAYLYARHNGCDEDRLAMLRSLIDDATAQKAALIAPPEMAAPPMGGPPMGAPPGMPPGAGGASVGGSVNINNSVPLQPVAPPLVGQ